MTVSVTVKDTQSGAKVGIRGGLPPLNWDQSFPMTQTGAAEFTATVPFDTSLPDDTIIPFKFVIEAGDEITWESLPNRTVSYKRLQAGLDAQWNQPLPFDRTALPVLTAEERLTDARFIIDTISTLHPGILRTLGAEGFEQASNTYLEQASDATTLEAWLTATYQFLGAIECDHTNAVYNQGPLLHGFLFDRPTWLPVSSEWRDNRLFVIHDATAVGDIPQGSEIIAIDGVPIETIRNRIVPLIASDGPALAPRLAKMRTQGGPNEIDLFGAYLALLYPSDKTQRDVTILRPGSSIQETVTVTQTTRPERAAKIPQPSEPLWTLKALDETTTLLSLRTIAPYELPFDWEDFLETAFSEIEAQGQTQLVIDIRDAVGGNSQVGTRLAEYLVDDTCLYNPFTARTRFLEIPDRLVDHVTVWDGSKVNLTGHAFETIGPYYEFPSLYSPLRIEAQPNAFSGETIILIGPNNVSASFYFAHMARACSLATLMGQTTGGSLRGINGGSTLRATAPQSGLVINLPYVGSFSKRDDADTGVPPQIEADVNDIIDADIADSLFSVIR